MIIACNRISKAFGVKNILVDVSFNINEKDRVAIVGLNGAGKSTLFKILTGELSYDAGSIAYEKDITIGYLSQLNALEEDTTIYENLLSVFDNLIQMENDIEELRLVIEEEGIKVTTETLDKYDSLNNKYKENGGYEYKSRIRGIVVGLGFTDEDFHRNVDTLSGGQKTRISLGKLLLQKPNLLLLDEPTNHLDINAINWLEDYLKNYNGTIMIISHDRYFLDKIVNNVIEIENTKSKIYQGNYTDFSVQKEIDRELAIKHYNNQQKTIKKQEEVIRVLKSYNREKSVKRARSREKLLSKMDVLDRPDPIPDSMRLTLEPNISSGYDILKVTGLSKSFDDLQLFSDVDFNIYKGDKVALIGDNGIGKSTLFKILLDQMTMDSGVINFGSNVFVGYYDQEHADLDENNTLFEELSSSYPKLTNTQIRNTLAAFVFTGDDASKKVRALSGGEKGRLSLAKIILSKANFLILDEPTNHLDMFSKEILEEAINAYMGTVFYISHDRYFINATADKIFHFTATGIKVYEGNYDYYLEHFEADDTIEAMKNGDSEGKNLRQRQKEEQAEQRKKEKLLITTEKNIEKNEKQLKEVEDQLTIASEKNDIELLQSLFEKKEQLENEQNSLYVILDELI